MIPTDTYLKQPGARGRLGGARRAALPSAPPSRPPFACDSPQPPAGKRDVSTPFAPGASPCLIGSPTQAFSSERSAAHVVGKENQGTRLSTQAQGQPAAASPKKPATPTTDAAAQSCTPGCDGTGAATGEAAGALLLELLRPLQRALDVASEGGGAGERALGAAMRGLGMPAHLVSQLSPHLGAAAAAGQPLHQAVADALRHQAPPRPSHGEGDTRRCARSAAWRRREHTRQRARSERRAEWGANTRWARRAARRRCGTRGSLRSHPAE